jgi:hypothetical protein
MAGILLNFCTKIPPPSPSRKPFSAIALPAARLATAKCPQALRTPARSRHILHRTPYLRILLKQPHAWPDASPNAFT